MDEDVEALSERNDAAEDEGEVGACGAKGGCVYEVRVRDVLGCYLFNRSEKTNSCQTLTIPDQTYSSRRVLMNSWAGRAGFSLDSTGFWPSFSLEKAAA